MACVTFNIQVFLKEHTVEALRALRQRFAAVVLQSAARGRIARNRLAKMKADQLKESLKINWTNIINDKQEQRNTILAFDQHQRNSISISDQQQCDTISTSDQQQQQHNAISTSDQPVPKTTSVSIQHEHNNISSSVQQQHNTISTCDRKLGEPVSVSDQQQQHNAVFASAFVRYLAILIVNVK